MKSTDPVKTAREQTDELAERLGFFVWNTGKWYLANDRGDQCDLPNDKRDLIIEAFANQRGVKVPEFAELKEYPKLRMLAKMAADAPCFTNAILAVTDAYKEGWADARSGVSQEQAERPHQAVGLHHPA